MKKRSNLKKHIVKTKTTYEKYMEDDGIRYTSRGCIFGAALFTLAIASDTLMNDEWFKPLGEVATYIYELKDELGLSGLFIFTCSVTLMMVFCRMRQTELEQQPKVINPVATNITNPEITTT